MKKKTLFSILVMILMGVFSLTNHAHAVSAQENPPIVHRVPRVPIILDGVKMDPERIKEFDGQPLYSIVDDQAKAEGVLYIYTTLEGVREHAKLTTQTQESRLSGCYDASTLYKAYGFWKPGGFLLVQPGNQVDFRWPDDTWDDDIESVETTPCNVYTKLYEYNYFTGSQLWLASSGQTNLVIYGWDNRASGVKVDP